jgi:hypothetical protein
VRLPRVGFTVRRMMVAVAVGGVTLGCWIEVLRIARLASDFRSKALACAQGEKFCRACLAKGTPAFAGWGSWQERLAYFTAMKDKYEHAARYPWLPVPPDPPEPE